MNNHLLFSPVERGLAFVAGLFNLIVGLAFFLLPEIHSLAFIWPVSISPVLDRFIGAIILGNSVGAIWLSSEREWARVRPLAIVAVVYGTLVALALLYDLTANNVKPVFWLYFLFDTPFLIVFYGLFLYHDIIPRFRRSPQSQPGRL